MYIHIYLYICTYTYIHIYIDRRKSPPFRGIFFFFATFRFEPAGERGKKRKKKRRGKREEFNFPKNWDCFSKGGPLVAAKSNRNVPKKRIPRGGGGGGFHNQYICIHQHIYTSLRYVCKSAQSVRGLSLSIHMYTNIHIHVYLEGKAPLISVDKEPVDECE